MVNCKHWRDIGNRDGGRCELLNRTVSHGVCRQCDKREPRDGEPVVNATIETSTPPMPMSAWPRLTRMVAKLRKPGDKGVGDTVERCLSMIGAKDMAAAYTLITGKDCGCANRRNKLNERYPYD